jgi:hypothetical protein
MMPIGEATEYTDHHAENVHEQELASCSDHKGGYPSRNQFSESSCLSEMVIESLHIQRDGIVRRNQPLIGSLSDKGEKGDPMRAEIRSDSSRGTVQR